MKREYAMGMAKVKENDFLAAIEHFTLAIELDNADVECYAERAVCYLNSNQFDLSMFDMNRCIELEPKNSYRYSCRAFLKSKMGDAAGAVADYEIAVALDPEDAIAYNNLGLAQESIGYRQKAQESFNKSNKIIGYEPKKFDNPELKSAENLSNEFARNQSNSKSRKKTAQEVFTTKSGFKDFLKFIRNGFKLKE